VQLGSSLDIFVNSVNQADFANAIILEDGKGDVAVEWNGGPWNFFSGINSIQVASWEPHPIATGNNVLLYSLGPLQSPQSLRLELIGFVNNLFVHVPGGAPLTVNAAQGIPFVPGVSTIHF
jgi:hypothetical protein